MQEQKRHQPNFHSADNKIAAHKMAPMIKGFSTVIEVDHGIDAAMND